MQVEGIAWGEPFGAKAQRGTSSPHAGPEVIHQGGTTFVEGLSFSDSDARGKLVRVVGTLRLHPDAWNTFGTTEPGYFYIDATSFEIIPSVSSPFLELIDSEDP